MTLSTAIIIPARYGSKRFPGKPIKAVIKGKSLIERVWRLASKVSGAEGIYIATDHDDIARHVESFGGKVLITDTQLQSGTDRVYNALLQLPNTIGAVVNLQGDAPLTPPWVIEALFHEISKGSGSAIATPAVELTQTQIAELEAAKQTAPSSGTTVVTSASGRALYFSKSMLPYRRDGKPARILRHVGLYAYRRDVLARLVEIPPTPLEVAEGLEQLRALESDIPIQVIPVDYRGRTHHSIDHPNDIAIAEAIIEREGEL